LYERGKFPSFGCNQSRTPECVFTIKVTSDYEARTEGLEEGIKVGDL